MMKKEFIENELIENLLRIRQATQSSEDGNRSTVPPSPKLREIIQKELKQLDKTSSKKLARRLKVRAPSRVGLNDGLLYPGSMFPLGTSARKVRSAAGHRAPLSGTVRVVVILAEFPDRAFANNNQHFENLFFSQGVLPNGSVREYYDEVSNGIIDLQGEVLGPYQLPQNLNAYAHGESGLGNIAPNARTMAKDAVMAADADVDYSLYDNDGDGFVDALVIIHAGFGAEQTGNVDDIWSHKWVLEGGTYNTDNIDIYAYLTVPEDAAIGVCCHELGHLLFGFPDLYDTDYSSEGIGDWCLMAGGSWNGGGDIPAHPCAWCKANQGWVNVQNVTTSGSQIFEDVKTSHTVHRLWKNGSSGNEYFLVENRQRTAFDAQLPGDGLLIWHVDDSIDTNSDETHYKVALEQADGNMDLENGNNRGDDGDPYPGSSNNTTFNSASNPDSDSYGGIDTCVAIKNIVASGADIVADISVSCVSKSLFKDIVDDGDKHLKEYAKDKYEKEIFKEKEYRKEILKEFRKEIIKDKREKEIFEKQALGDKYGDKPDIDKSTSYDKGFADDKMTDGKYGDGKFEDGKFGDGKFGDGKYTDGDFGFPGGPRKPCQQFDQQGDIEPYIRSKLRPDLSKGALAEEDDVKLIKKKVQENASKAKRSFDTKAGI